MPIEVRRTYTRLGEPNTWYAARVENRRVIPYYRCPNGHYGYLEDHEVDAEGRVTPSVVCPEAGCTFHDYITLDGWQELEP